MRNDHPAIVVDGMPYHGLVIITMFRKESSMLRKLLIRTEIPEDIPEIRRLNDLAFHGPVEGSIVDALRERCPDVLSLVAVEGGRIVGHLFFSPVTINGMTGNEAMGLGPMAVLPKFQRKGIGKALINEGIRKLEQSGCAVVVVLGHTEYYPQFGFVPASHYGLKSQWEGIPADVFMVRFLKKEKIGLVSGIVRYQPEFDTAAWQIG
jgi:putative acetyltransferase